MNIKEARELFPHLKTGKIYFNHAATGPISIPVKEALTNYIFEKSENNIDNFPLLLSKIKETKNELGKLINTTADRIAFLDNTSNGLNILAQGVQLKKGDEILLNNIEFPSNIYPFLNLQKNGVEINFVKSNNGIVSAEDIINYIKPNTKLISISYVQFLSGYRVDLEKIGKVCKEKNIIFSVDAIQGLGAVKLDIKKCNIDFVSCGTQKWLLGLQGLAFIYISKSLQEKLIQKFVGWTSVDDAWNLLNYNLELKKSADSFQNGTLNAIGIFALNASLNLFKSFGYDKVEERVLSNTNYFINELEKIGKPAHTKLDKNNLSGIVSFKDSNSEEIFNKLKEKNINCAVREGMIRFSPHFYNTKEDIDKVITVLKYMI